MPPWIKGAFQFDAQLGAGVLIVRLLAALLLGCAVAGIYRITHGKSDRPARSLMATLVMLSVLIAMVTLVIGENQARAFSLVGALAIIRFRTIVEDTRDTAFVIFAVAVGMGAGAGYLALTLMGLPFAAAAALLFRSPPVMATTPDYHLTLRVGLARDPEEPVRDALAKLFLRHELTSTSTARQGAVLELGYLVRMRPAESAAAIVAELNGLPGVQGVEWRAA